MYGGKNDQDILAAFGAGSFLQRHSAAEGERLKLATTTSLQDTGLLDVIKEKFDAKYNVSLDVVSGGTGIAIQYGERGDVDVLIVHDKVRELKFIADGQGLERRCIAYNYFVVVGPKDDPAGIKGMNATQAFTTIMAKGKADSAKVKFVSRGDNSGTHAREIAALEECRLQLQPGQQLRALVYRCRTGHGRHTEHCQ